MELVHVKMKNGEDIVGIAIERPTTTYNEQPYIAVKDPISIVIDPHIGMFAKSWLLFSESDTTRIKSSDILFCYAASDKAVSYCNEFMNRLAQSSKEQSDSIDELESIFNEMMESKLSTKH